MTSLSISEASNRQKGFSFLSLVVATLALSLTLSLCLVAVQPIVERDRTQDTMKRMEQLRYAVKEYRRQNGGSGPATLEGLVQSNGTDCTVSSDVDNRQLQGWCGPYIDQVFQEGQNAFRMDAWGREVQLDSTRLLSCGANGSCGDGDDIAIEI